MRLHRRAWLYAFVSLSAAFVGGAITPVLVAGLLHSVL